VEVAGSVGDIGVFVGGRGVGVTVAVGGMGVAEGGTGVAVGSTGVAVGGMDATAGGTAVSVDGAGVSVGETDVTVDWACPQPVPRVSTIITIAIALQRVDMIPFLPIENLGRSTRQCTRNPALCGDHSGIPTAF
jgi:hypothetical protein